MGCGSSVDHGPDTASSVVERPCQDVLRLFREINNLEMWSDARSAEEPGVCSQSIAMGARNVVSRVTHGISDEPDQYLDEVLASVPVYSYEDFDFVRDWRLEVTNACDGVFEPVPGVLGSSTANITPGIDAKPNGQEDKASSTLTSTSVNTEAALVMNRTGCKPDYLSPGTPTSASKNDSTETVAHLPPKGSSKYADFSLPHQVMDEYDNEVTMARLEQIDQASKPLKPMAAGNHAQPLKRQYSGLAA